MATKKSSHPDDADQYDPSEQYETQAGTQRQAAAYDHQSQKQAEAPKGTPSQAELDKDIPPVKPDEAEALLKAGHRLRKRGDDPQTQWIAITRQKGDLVICFPATEDNIKDYIDKAGDDLILAE